MSTPAEKANLARIRDNQRRSRARRKEYLQDLEQKLRMCELQGIEASHEMQAAARKVADENKRLRSLLNRHGVNDDNIEAYVQTGIVAPAGDTSLPQYRSGSTGNAVQTLEQLLTPRRPSCLEPSAPFCAPSSSTAGSHAAGAGGVGRTSREGSFTSVSTSNTMWDTATMPTASIPQQSRTLPSSNSQLNKMASPQGFISPTQSTGSANKTEAAITLSGLGSVMEPPRPSHVNVSPGTASQEPQATQAYSFDVSMQMHNPPSYTTAHRHHKHALSPQSCGPGPSSSLYAATTASQPQTSRGTNCCMATDLITSMTGADPQSVRSSLGCVPGMDCQVDNTTFNNAIERYTATTIGM
ncbi:uncharacterized protein MKZ38_003235 [Zalerion maritima]|uniref:BZIP domain-containing protein n=1 Tax=Zalerion maritima TaxID=339359 RepID=A0AAD5WYA8_9PEZI|nr:uncharacterized protein MKZ38_003235 [Zalerion maritima]